MAMAVASARYESEDAYPIDYREIFFRDPSLSRFLIFFFFIFLLLKLFAIRSTNAYGQRNLSTIYVSISVSCLFMPIKLKSIREIIMKS